MIGDEVVYIGKGSIRDRYQTDPRRASWGISKIEYSVIKDDQKALEWEDWWLKRFRKENKGRPGEVQPDRRCWWRSALISPIVSRYVTGLYWMRRLEKLESGKEQSGDGRLCK